MTTRKTSAAVGKAWTTNEQRVLILAYNAMRNADTIGHKYSKAAINRFLRGDHNTSTQYDRDAECARLIGLYIDDAEALAARSRGSVEAKLMNISGARETLGLPILKGYKPAPNFQRSLVDLVKQLER